jgi:hypothetical protein
MLRDDDGFDGVDCPLCHRTFSTYASMTDQLAQQ